MASGTFYPVVNGDDGYWYGAVFQAAGPLYMGNVGVAANVFIRFSNVTIPQGVTITSAFIRFISYDNQSAEIVNIDVHFNNVDDAQAPTSVAGAEALDLTSSVPWDNVESWVDGNQYDTPEIKTILQTIVNRPGWGSGNAVQAVLRDDNSGAYRRPNSIDYSEEAELHVTWETAPETTFTFTNPVPAHLSTAYGTTEQLYLTTTISGSEPSYTYDAMFYTSSGIQIGTTVSGINSGSPAASNANLLTPSGVDYGWYVTATSSGSEDTSSTYTFSNRFLASGTTEVDGTLTSGIDVRLYRRDTGELVGTATSTVSGIFNIETQHNSDCYCVALSPYTNTNSLIYDFLESGD